MLIKDDDSIHWLHDTDMLMLVKGERVIGEGGTMYTVLTMPGERWHPQLHPDPGIVNYPSRVFRDRRGRRGN